MGIGGGLVDAAAAHSVIDGDIDLLKENFADIVALLDQVNEGLALADQIVLMAKDKQVIKNSRMSLTMRKMLSLAWLLLLNWCSSQIGATIWASSQLIHWLLQLGQLKLPFQRAVLWKETICLLTLNWIRRKNPGCLYMLPSCLVKGVPQQIAQKDGPGGCEPIGLQGMNGGQFCCLVWRRGSSGTDQEP